VGESMVLLDALEDGAPSPGSTLALRIAGAESNFAIALARLGIGVRWVSRLGRDHLGDLVFTTLEAEGLDLQFVVRDGAAPTGAFFKWRSGGRSSVSYLRQGSAASHLSFEDLPPPSFEGIELVHLTGITMALSETARAVVVEAARRARALGLVVIFDPNYRPPLWDSPEAAGRACRELFPYVDWLLCGREEGAAIFGVDDPGDLVDSLASDGVDAVVRVGDRGAVLAGPRGPAAVVPRRVESVADEVGAGDGFAAGFSFGLLAGWHPARCARTGNLIAAWALRGTGDWETFPLLDEVRTELEGDDGEESGGDSTAG
jgi:2-dehydro-3-deoxygluconokinase